MASSPRREVIPMKRDCNKLNFFISIGSRVEHVRAG